MLGDFRFLKRIDRNLSNIEIMKNSKLEIINDTKKSFYLDTFSNFRSNLAQSK